MRHLGQALPRRAVLATTLLALRPARAELSTLDGLKARGSLRVATTGANKPYTFAGEDGALQGYDVDWAGLISAGLGVRAAFIRLDWRGILPGLIAHQFDCAMSAVRVTAQRAAAFDFSAPYGTDSITVAALSTNNDINGIGDLRGKTIAAAAGSVQDQFAREHAGTSDLRRLPGLPEVLLAVQLGQVDAAVVGRGGAAAFIRETHAPLRLVGDYDGGDLAAVFPKHSAELVAAVDAIITARRADGSYDAIKQRWFGTA